MHALLNLSLIPEAFHLLEYPTQSTSMLVVVELVAYLTFLYFELGSLV